MNNIENGMCNSTHIILVSSDSDYWDLISAIPEARFLVLTERAQCSPQVNNPRLKSRACGSKPWLTSLSAKSTTLRENV